MRCLAIGFLIFLGLDCHTGKKVTGSSHDLDGHWIPVRQEIAGNSLPSTGFAKQQLIISDSNYTFNAESVDKGIAYYKEGKMDIYGKEGVNNGKHFMAIYKFENGHLTICYNLAGDSYPETFDTKNKQKYFLSEFVKGEMKP